MSPALALLSRQSQETPSRAEVPGLCPSPAVSQAASYCPRLQMGNLRFGRSSSHPDAKVWLLPPCPVTVPSGCSPFVPLPAPCPTRVPLQLLLMLLEERGKPGPVQASKASKDGKAGAAPAQLGGEQGLDSCLVTGVSR